MNPTQPAGAQSPSDTITRIRDYLAGGGLFNPELANHVAVRDLLIDCRADLSAAHAALAEAQRDAARYRWLKENGPTYHGACQGTASMSIGRGPYIYLEVPAHNNFSNFVLNGDSADRIIDAAMSSTGEGSGG